MYGSLLNFPEPMFADFERLRRELDDFFGAGMPSSIRSVAPGSFPALNIGNTPDSVEIYAFAPGIDPDKLELTLDRGLLTIAGERPSALPDGQAAPQGQNGQNGQSRKVSVYSRERVGGSFRRVVSLPEDLDPAKVQASYRDGVLRVSIARRAAAQPRRITIQ